MGLAKLVHFDLLVGSPDCTRVTAKKSARPFGNRDRYAKECENFDQNDHVHTSLDWGDRNRGKKSRYNLPNGTLNFRI